MQQDPQITPSIAQPDAPAGNLFDRYAPAALKPYGRLARWDRPIGWWLLLLPCWWSAALAAIHAGRPFPDIWHLVLFLIGAIAMRGAGCTYNDIVDREIDAKVARTATRPLPSGAVTARQAAIFLALQAVAGLLVLLQFNAFAIATGIASLGAVAIYPLMKRITWWPQSVLGLAFSWGALMGWAAALGRLDAAPILLYAGGIAWTIGYDTIYAVQDKEDDALIGVKSTARLFGDKAPMWVSVFFVAATILFAGATWLAGGGIIAFAGLAAGAAHMVWQIRRFDPADGTTALRLFRSNRDYGLILFAGFCLDALF
ncbi:MAG: 4-hydroxybenzoate octaprenyltransferase [Rhodobiaceae bacterium]|nr:4-hydroxybenzoate octaprenyltransferase [Rhodobiaceae bacterium]